MIQPPEKYPEMAKSHESWTAYDHQVAIEQVKWWSPAASLPDPIDYSWVLYFNTSKKKWKRSSQLNASPELAWSPDLNSSVPVEPKSPWWWPIRDPQKTTAGKTANIFHQTRPCKRTPVAIFRNHRRYYEHMLDHTVRCSHLSIYCGLRRDLMWLPSGNLT